MNRLEITSFKERVDLVKVVGHYSTLERKGAAYLGLCPFHDDHHPSLRVDPAKGVYHCFSCGAGGDVFRFVQEKEGCSFGEAVRLCADICHLPVPALDAGLQGNYPFQPVAYPACVFAIPHRVQERGGGRYPHKDGPPHRSHSPPSPVRSGRHLLRLRN